MLEQEVMIFTRFRCRMFLKAPHSSMKLLDAPRRCRLRALIATSVPSSSMSPLYTAKINYHLQSSCISGRESNFRGDEMLKNL
ncbi:hypothetical protein POPTR_018G120901v4 [Populus trichocarpa]|uniref:Uncharacterized protein n=1 Tax=Populus trichocarpa TaxID=3694 RepID=A0ACC0RP94_POPTR|nr:hypothetical protein POPTR_018G120901v4 [Populus trichocarpa]